MKREQHEDRAGGRDNDGRVTDPPCDGQDAAMGASKEVRSEAPPPPRLVLAAVIGVIGVVGVGIVALLSSAEHQLHDPVHALQQLDLLYLDEPAPFYDELGFHRGQPALLVVCVECDAPEISAQVAVTDDPAIAAAYALATVDGRIGPGYAVIDSRGHVRYRTFDFDVDDHEFEVQTVVDGVE